MMLFNVFAPIFPKLFLNVGGVDRLLAVHFGIVIDGYSRLHSFDMDLLESHIVKNILQENKVETTKQKGKRKKKPRCLSPSNKKACHTISIAPMQRCLSPSNKKACHTINIAPMQSFAKMITQKYHKEHLKEVARSPPVHPPKSVERNKKYIDERNGANITFRTQ
jgi:hypothetical protein